MTKEFYEVVLPPSGLYCTVGITQNERVITHFHTTLEAAIARGAAHSNAAINAYFALATFAEETGGRKAANASLLKCFFIDLDCGEGKPYADQAAGATALRAFVDATKLPRPYVVNSGNGLHAYWPFEEAIDVGAWAPLARRFKALCIQHGLHIDRSVTADAARILRMPGTVNYKRTPAAVALMVTGTVVPLDTLRHLLPEIEPRADIAAARLHGVDAMTRALAGDDFPPSSFARLVRRSLRGHGCAQIAHAVENAATLEEPLWRAALSIAWRCTDAETAIHKLSRPHPGYSHELTEEKAQGTKGPMTCQWYRENSPTLCTGCQRTCTSPILLGRTVEEAEAVNDTYVVQQVLDADNTELGEARTVGIEIPAYPKPYFRGVNGGVFMRTKDKEGEPIEIEIYSYDLYLTSRFYDSTESGDGEGELVGVNLHTPHDGIRRFIAPVKELLTREKMRDLLLKHGVIAINKELDNIMSYFAASARNLQKMFAADRTRNQMGWTADETGFVVGELEYTARGTMLAPAASATRDMAGKLSQKGSLAVWVRMVDFYAKPGMELHAFGLFTGFGAPLLRLLGGIDVRGATINLMHPKSGTGKTTVLMAANSIFGHPSDLLLKKDDTPASRLQWLGTLNSMAATVDEITNWPEEELSEFLYDVPQGRGRHRMESQSNRLRANTTSWTTLVLSSSNSSAYDKLTKLKSTADGELRRLIEFRLARPSAVDKAQSDVVFSALGDNYGLAGPVFMKYVLANKDAVVERLQAMRTRIDAALKLDQSDRFYSVVLSCIFVGAAIAGELGLHHIPLQPVFNAVTAAVQAIKDEVIAPATDNTSAAVEALMTYINDNVSNALIINHHKTGGVPNAPINPNFRGPIKMRYEPDTRELWIPAATLRDYMVGRQVDIRHAVYTMAADGILKHEGRAVPKRLGAGALGNFEAGSVRCYCVSGEHLSLDDLSEKAAAADGPAEA